MRRHFPPAFCTKIILCQGIIENVLLLHKTSLSACLKNLKWPLADGWPQMTQLLPGLYPGLQASLTMLTFLILVSLLMLGYQQVLEVCYED